MVLISTILAIFTVILIGYAAARMRLLSEAAGDGLSQFVFVISSPLLLFRTTINADFQGVAPWALWASYFAGAVLCWAASHCAIRALFGRDRRAGVVAGISGAFSNLVFLGIPLVTGVFGPDGVTTLSLIISVHMPLMMAASIALNEWAMIRDGQFVASVSIFRKLSGFITVLVCNPLVIGILLGWIWRLTGLELPAFAGRIINMLADVAGPVALFAMGMGLHKFGIAGNVRAAAMLGSFKLMLMPAIVFCMAWVFGLPPMAAKVAITAAALPSGINAYLIAVRFGIGQGLSSSSMVLSTACSALTLGMWIAFAEYVFG
ncbi:AEC family transporter [Paraburkholderia aspalathi]|nr:AEC family transporter [Paraburkholderia aspalathi]